MATLTVYECGETGLDLAANLSAAAAGGDDLPNGEGDAFLLVVNGSGSSINVTATVQNPNRDIEGMGLMTKASVVTAVAAGVSKLIGPFPRAAFNKSNGAVAITYSAVTTVSVKAHRAPRK